MNGLKTLTLTRRSRGRSRSMSRRRRKPSQGRRRVQNEEREKERGRRVGGKGSQHTAHQQLQSLTVSWVRQRRGISWWPQAQRQWRRGRCRRRG
ncbi:MAG: hypothetical protein ACT6T3_21330 [Agrobacterium sp.]|uniref:hypothetical protein n=1 Tax=Agrobacterium sp. TaxID=361 RepID=UPI004034AF51